MNEKLYVTDTKPVLDGIFLCLFCYRNFFFVSNKQPIELGPVTVHLQ
jgi:hypothetical protein